MYSFGLVLWEMVNRAIPFIELKKEELFEKVGIHGHRPNVFTEHASKNTPSSIVKMITTCWDQDPSVRPSFAGIKNNNYSVPTFIHK